MKIITIVFCLFISINVLAQGADTVHKDTSKPFIIVDARPIDDYPKPLYIVDGIIYKRNIRRVNPNNILEISVLKDAQAVAPYGPKGGNGVIIIATKGYAKKEYQNKLSAFSIEYKAYLQTHQNNDNQILYIMNGIPLNGTPMTAKENEYVTLKLYGIPVKNIKTVGYSDNYLEGMKSGATLIITTKQ